MAGKNRIGAVAGVSVFLAVLAGLAFASNDANAQEPSAPPGGGGSSGITFPTFSGTQGAAKLKELAELAGLHSDWVLFFTAVARGESRFTSNVVLGDPSLFPAGSVPSPINDQYGPSEAAGALTAYNRAKGYGRFANCPWPASAYSWGAGGWLGQIPSNAWEAYKQTPLECRHPWYLLHPVDQIITAIEQMRRLTGWAAFEAQPTMLTARVGWADPSRMDDPQYRESRAKKFADDLVAIGLPADWYMAPVPPLPAKGDIYARWNALMQASGLAPGKVGP